LVDRPALDQLSKDALIALLLAQEVRIAELERRLGLNSSNSGKPPSSDGLKKPPRTSSLRQPSGRKTGGQKGHPGETLRRSETPDAVVDHYPARCGACGAPLTEAMATDFVARQVFDLPEPQPLIVTEHRAHGCRCAACGSQTRGGFPAWVNAPVQYGKRIGALVLYLLHYQLLPEKRLATLMADLFGVTLVTATIARISQDCAERFQGLAAAVRDRVAAAPVKHLDETGFRIGGKTQWLHVASTMLLTFYRVSARRGSLLAGLTGIVVHDHWKPYYTLTGVLHALCNAHHLRELKALAEIEKEDWARRMQRLLRRACHAVNLAREQDVPLKPGLIALIERRYDAIVADGMAFHGAQPALTKIRPRGRPPRRVGHNLLLRLSTYQQDVLRFLTDPLVPFTNNLAERDGRMMKLRQKISGGFRSKDGAKDFAVIRSVLSTARKQGWDILATLTANPDSLLSQLRAG
jgi:transposase